jgi:chemotaxis family two-component system response regulator PixH
MGTALVIEDSQTELSIIKDFCHALGIHTVVASSGEQALERLQQLQPNLIILDVVLPGRSGFELCRELKAAETTKKIPVILCSTKNSDMDKFWGLRQGADAYITKPIDQDIFNTTLKQFLSL